MSSSSMTKFTSRPTRTSAESVFQSDEARSLKNVFEILLGKKYSILLFAAALAALASYHHRHFPSYPAVATLYVQGRDSSPLQAAITTLSEKAVFGNGSANYVDKN